MSEGIKTITALGGANEFACYLYVRRGETHTLRKDHAAALKDFTYAIDSKMSNCLDVFEKRGDIYAVRGNWRAAIDDYSREMALFEHRIPRLHAKRGNAYLRSGEPEKAVADLDQALEFSSCGPLFRIRAEALRLLGKNDLADQDERKAVEYSRGRSNDQCAFR